MADIQLDDSRAREVREDDAEHPTVFDRVARLHQRLDAGTTSPQQAQQQGQEMGY